MAEKCDRYTFGDSVLAAERLGIVAEVFNATTAQFLRTRGVARPDLAVDLGCGPGHTTRLLNQTVSPRRTIAVDVSTAFVEVATSRLGHTVDVIHGDVRDLPKVVSAVDLMFARLLLTHLADPFGAIRHWVSRLSGGGILLLEEVESITTEDPTFRAYLNLQRRMLAANGQTLEIGSVLEAAHTQSVGYHSELASASPPAGLVARMFAMNFEIWRHEPVIESLATINDLDEIAAALQELLSADATTEPITWRLRQIVVSPKS